MNRTGVVHGGVEVPVHEVPLDLAPDGRAAEKTGEAPAAASGGGGTRSGNVGPGEESDSEKKKSSGLSDHRCVSFFRVLSLTPCVLVKLEGALKSIQSFLAGFVAL